MFPYPIATPQGCNIQTFYGPGTSATTKTNFFTWNKPVGVSHVYMMLIGGGGTGDSASGGGSGAVTVWYGAAQHTPNNLQVSVGRNEDQALVYMYSSAGRTLLLQANGGSGATAGAATSASPFAASGFYQSTAGQGGSTGSVTASTTTFLSGGSDSTIETVTANYGYFVPGNGAGFFQMQPIIVGAGGSANGLGGIGCGGGADSVGGPGMVLIASW
jgi:hypothetical protein